MFIASKLLLFVTQPLAWVALLLLCGLLAAKLGLTWGRRWAPRLSWAALAVLLLQGWEPLPDALIRQLELRHPELAADTPLQDFAGVLLLGGALEPAYVWQGHSQVALNDAAERMTAAVPLLQKQPGLRLLFTGGEGELLATGITEADRAALFFASMGVPRERLVMESASRNTFENAVFSARLDVVVHQRGQQVVGQRNGVEVTGEVQVDVLHGHHLGITAPCRATLHAKHRPE